MKLPLSNIEEWSDYVPSTMWQIAIVYLTVFKFVSNANEACACALLRQTSVFTISQHRLLCYNFFRHFFVRNTTRKNLKTIFVICYDSIMNFKSYRNMNLKSIFYDKYIIWTSKRVFVGQMTS